MKRTIDLITTLFLVMGLSCNGEKKECRLIPEEQLMFKLCIHPPGDCSNETYAEHRKNLILEVESISSGQILLSDPVTEERYKLHTVLSLPVSVGKKYRVHNEYIVDFCSTSLLEIYSENGEMLFVGMTNNSFPEGFNVFGGITIEKIWGECSKSDEYGNYGLKFTCGEESVKLYQSETGNLTCNGEEYEIHVNMAEGRKEVNCTVENPCPTDLCFDNNSFYITKR